MSVNCDITEIFSNYGQFAAIQKLDFLRMVYQTYMFISSNLLSYENWKQT